LLNILRIARNVIGFFLLIFTIIYLFILIPVVQNEAARRVTKILSEELNTTVSLKNISIDFFDKLVINEFYVEDLKGDTLLYSGQLKVNINTSIPALLRRQLEIEEITLSNGSFNIRRDSSELVNNLGFIAEYFEKSDTTVLSDTTSNAPFYLNVKALYLNNLTFNRSDFFDGEDISVNVGQGEILIKELNIPESRLDIKSVTISNPFVDLTQYKWIDEEGIDKPRSPFLITVDRIDIGCGQFILNNSRRSNNKLTDDNTLDLDYLRAYDIDLGVNNFRYQDWTFAGALESLTAKDRSGFVVENFSADEIKITERRAELNGMRILTPDSNLGDTIIFKYRRFPDWREFPNKVLIDARFHNDAIIKVGDIMAFAPRLESNPFFQKNREEIVKINGRINGKINNLRGRDLTISLAGNTFLKGDFNSRNLAVKDEQYLDLRLQRLVTNISTIKQIIPNFRPPENFDKLGNIDFKGEFNGFFVDFVAYGDLRTDLGRAELDMRMNLKEGREKARYSGELSLTDFDLERWTGNPNFGTVTFVSQVKNGIGITGATAQADLTAAIQNFTFKGYTYDNLYVEGNLKERFFNGDFNINDENIVFDFDGKVDFTRPKPLFDFKANVKKLALQPLNLANKDLVLAGKINQLYLEDTKISDIRGNAIVSDFNIVQNGRDTFRIDTISIISEIDEEGMKRFFVDSDIARAELEGLFDLSKIPQTYTRFFAKNFPEFAERLNVKTDTSIYLAPQQYSFDIDIYNSKNFNRLIHPGLGNLANIRADGKIDNVSDKLKWDVNVPILQFNNITLSDINTYGETEEDEGNLNFEIFDTQIRNINIPPFKLMSIVDGDTVDFALNLISNSELLDNINLDGQIYPNGDYTELTLNESALIFLSDVWKIESGNYIRAGNNRVEAQNFRLTSEGREITLNTIGDKGLEINAENFDLKFINKIWKEDRFDLAGPFTFNISADNVFRLQGLNAYVEADTFLINNDDWGVLRVDANAKSIKDKFSTYLNLYQETSGRQLLIEGYYNPIDLYIEPGTIGFNTEVPNYLNLDFHLSNFPLFMLEYLIKNGITDTQGSIDADFKMKGKPNRLVMDGKAKVNNLGVTVDYLNTRYFADNQTLILRENMLDATGTYITDELGNKANLFGGLIHNYLRNWELAVTASSDNFLFLDTEKGDNPLYYGYGIGEGTVAFTGSFKRTNIDIRAVTGTGTTMSIPISYEQDAEEVNFIKFKTKKKIFAIEDSAEKQLPTGGEILGINLSMDLELTNAAVMKMIFDEQAGDIIEGRGNGNIAIAVPRGLDKFTMFGNYEIESGEYLFTLKNIVNKPFVVKRGGTIVWSGDPFGADIDLVAEYKDLSVAPFNFIQEFLVGTTSDVQRLAAQATQVDLIMNLKGELLKPDITFDFEFPNVKGELKTYVDSKMRTIDRNPNELNRQVFGLIVAGQFLPNSTTISDSGIAIGINTVTEMLSQQLSLYLTDLVSGWLKDDGLISGIDFDIAYSRFQGASIAGNVEGRANNELQVRLKNYLFDERVAVYGGVNIDLDNQQGTPINNGGAFYAGDFAIEYFLTDDKQFKIRFYQSIQPDIAGGKRNKTGVGLSYRKEYNSFGEFLRGLKKTTEELKKDED
jgi:hypothetical protein